MLLTMKTTFSSVKATEIMILIITSVSFGTMAIPHNLVDGNKEDFCIQYKASINTILINCKSANLTDLYAALDSPKILKKESTGIWFLNANIRVYDKATFHINSTDTSWLKINSTSGIANSIEVRGTMQIDSVKISSWDSIGNSYASTSSNGKTPRSYIKIEEGSHLHPAKADITNSEIAHLGYNASSSWGLSYYSGADSIIKNNKIHHLWYGFYSANYRFGVYNILIENNDFFDNHLYGIDPHSGTHDLVIRNNTVYNNGKHGIICSRHCDNITIEENKVFDNFDRGIMLDKNITNSTIADNIIYHNTAQIAIHTLSNSNKIDNNTVYGGEIGIEISDRSSDNLVSNNVINDTRHGIYLLDAGQRNKFFSNSINNASDCAILIEDAGRRISERITSDQGIFQNNSLSDIGEIVRLHNSSATDTRSTDNVGCIRMEGFL